MKNYIQQSLHKTESEEETVENLDNSPEETKKAKISRKKRQIVPAENIEKVKEKQEKSENKSMETRKAKKSRKKSPIVSHILIVMFLITDLLCLN